MIFLAEPPAGSCHIHLQLLTSRILGSPIWLEETATRDCCGRWRRTASGGGTIVVAVMNRSAFQSLEATACLSSHDRNVSRCRAVDITAFLAGIYFIISRRLFHTSIRNGAGRIIAKRRRTNVTLNEPIFRCSVKSTPCHMTRLVLCSS